MGDVNLEIKLKNLEEKVDELEIGAVEVDNMTITRNAADELEIAPEVIESINNSAIGVQTNTSDINTITAKLSNLEKNNASNNLFSVKMPSGTSEHGNTYTPIKLKPNTNYTLSTNLPSAGGSAELFFMVGNVSSGISTSGNGVWLDHPRTITSDANGYVTVCYRNLATGHDLSLFEYMLNEGASALPYEPYRGLSNEQITEDIAELKKYKDKSVTTVANGIAEISDSELTGFYIPQVISVSNSNSCIIDIKYDNSESKWKIYSDKAQTVTIRFFKQV